MALTPASTSDGMRSQIAIMTSLPTIDSVTAGAKFFRGDLHIHSFGGSHDVNDATMTAAAIVATALAEGLSIVALTDHNEIKNVDAALAAARGLSVCVIPGVELSTPQGHLLVYARDLAALEAFYGKLKIVDRGMQNSRCQTSMLECLELIDTSNGFAALAHVDVPSGFEQTLPRASPHKLDILTHPALMAAEVKDIASPISYGTDDPDQARAKMGAKRRIRLHTGPHQTLARVLSSDSHGLGALGRNAKGAQRLTRYKMESPTFDGLLLALRDYEARIRLEDDIPVTVPCVRGVRIVGGFLDGQVVQLSPNLNCIIGGRGAGKSTLFESIRILSQIPSENRVLDGDTWPDTLELEWTDEAGVVHQLVRRRGDRVENVSHVDGPCSFHVECYGQGETASTSRRAQAEPIALLAYLDQFVDFETFRADDETVCHELLENQKKLEEAKLKVEEIPKYKDLLSRAKQQIEALAKAEAKEVLELERRLADERRVRESMSECLSELKSDYDAFSPHERLTELKRLADPTPLKIGVDQCGKILELVEAVEADVRVLSKDLFDKLAVFSKAVSEHVGTWKLAERAVQLEIDQKRKELSDKGARLDYAFIQKVAQDEARYQKAVDQLAAWVPYKSKVEKERGDLHKRRRSLRGDISTRRIAYSSLANKTLENALTDLVVTVRFTANALSPAAESLIQQTMAWRTSQVPRANLLVEGLGVFGLLDAVSTKDVEAITGIKEGGVATFTPADATELINRLREPSVLYQLERCSVEDLPRI